MAVIIDINQEEVNLNLFKIFVSLAKYKFNILSLIELLLEYLYN